MRRFLLTPVLALALVFGAGTAPTVAITGGQPDGDGHPYVALLLAPGLTFCSGTLISPTTILTAGHCTDFWDWIVDDPRYTLDRIMVSFDPVASVDENWMPDGGTWYPASEWITHPEYVDAEWPFTWDYGLLYLEAPVDITPALLPDEGLINELVPANGQTRTRFKDVGYGIQGNIFGGGTPLRDINWTRKVAIQRYAPGKGATTGEFHETWFIVNNVPSPRHGGACGGDSGSPVLVHADGELGNTIVAVHTGGYRLGYNGVLCGRMTSLNHRIDIPGVLDWITENTR
jgi:hypothetical protein